MPKSTRLSGRQGGLERKLAAYAMAGGALVAGTAGDASADLITTPINETIGTGVGQASSYSLTVGGVDLTFSATFDPSNPSAEIDVTAAATSSYVIDSFAIGPFTEYIPAALSSGAVVGSSDSYSSSVSPTKLSPIMAQYTTTTSGEFAGLSNAYLGVSFTDPSTSLTDYGYVTLSVSGTTDPTTPTAMATIESFTYDNMGNPVTIPGVASVPEPSSLATVAMGAAGIGAYLASRKRRATV